MPNARATRLLLPCCIATLLLAPAAVAQTTVWGFEISSRGENVIWTSAAAIGTDAPAYTLTFEIQEMWATAFFAWEVDVLITDRLPPEMITDTKTLAAPLPILLFDDAVVYPEPPAEPGFAAEIAMGLDDAGHGFVSMDNIILDVMEVEAPPLGWITVEMRGIRMVGQLSATPANVLVADTAQVNIAEGGSAAVAVTLAAAPAAEVTVDLALTDGGVTLTSPALLVFTPDNWDAAQVATLAAAEDDDGAANEATLTFSADGCVPATVTIRVPEPDCNGNGIADEQELADGDVADCNGNGIPDECDIAAGDSADVNGNGIPDECEPDCNANGIPDDVDIAAGTSPDCDGNGIPDECDLATGDAADLNGNGTPDTCEPDCNGNGVPDDLDIADGISDDCDGNGVPDECDLAADPSLDADGNGLLDACETPPPADPNAPTEDPTSENDPPAEAPAEQDQAAADPPADQPARDLPEAGLLCPCLAMLLLTVGVVGAARGRGRHAT